MAPVEFLIPQPALNEILFAVVVQVNKKVAALLPRPYKMKMRKNFFTGVRLFWGVCHLLRLAQSCHIRHCRNLILQSGADLKT